MPPTEVGFPCFRVPNSHVSDLEENITHRSSDRSVSFAELIPHFRIYKTLDVGFELQKCRYRDCCSKAWARLGNLSKWLRFCLPATRHAFST